MVPCSRSRIKAAPVKMIDSMVILLMICITEVNHSVLQVGIEHDADHEIDRQVGGTTGIAHIAQHLLADDLLQMPTPLPAMATAVASALTCTLGLRFARRSCSNLGGISITKMKRSASMPGPISLAEISCGVSEEGRQDGFLDAPRDFRMVFIDDGDRGVIDLELGAGCHGINGVS